MREVPANQNARGNILHMLPQKLVFVVSAPRSGSTWLQLLLSQNENTVSCQETHLFNHYLKSVFQSHSHFLSNERGVGLSNILADQDIIELVREFSSGALARITASKPNACIFIEKTPGHIERYEPILKIFPDAYFVEIVRDPRAMVASMRAVDFGDWAKPGILANTDIWLAAVRHGEALATATKHHIRVRYEDLFADGATTLAKIWAKLGEPCSIETAQQHFDAVAFNKLKSRSAPIESPWDIGKEPANFYRKGQPDSWLEELSTRQIALIESAAKKEMESLHYEAVTEGVRVNWPAWLRRKLAKLSNALSWYRTKL